MMNAAMDQRQSSFSLWDLRRFLRPHWAALSGAALAMTARAMVLLVIPWPLKFVIDSVISQKPLPVWLAGFLPDPLSHRVALLDVLGIVMLLFAVADSALAYAGGRLLLRVGQRAVFDIRRSLFAHLQRLSLAFHRRQKSGDLMARLGGDIQTLQDFVVSVGTGLFAHLLTIIGMAGIMLAIDWRYALVVIASVPLLLAITQRHTRRLKQAFRLARRKEGELWSMAQETPASRSSRRMAGNPLRKTVFVNAPNGAWMRHWKPTNCKCVLPPGGRPGGRGRGDSCLVRRLPGVGRTHHDGRIAGFSRLSARHGGASASVRQDGRNRQ